jgi:hypothetical protein|tara:strand:+ start:983 stop:1138 length:156 start_codon:yes stop_codon:yes gene_type:complete
MQKLSKTNTPEITQDDVVESEQPFKPDTFSMTFPDGTVFNVIMNSTSGDTE